MESPVGFSDGAFCVGVWGRSRISRGSFLESRGGPFLASAQAFELIGALDPVFDHGSWYANFLAFGYSIEVETATQRVAPVDCDDVPDEWFPLLVVWFPSD